eukprot:2531621-Rhodomonas_salina.5
MHSTAYRALFQSLTRHDDQPGIFSWQARRGGDVWMGQLRTLMKSINKWNVSLDVSTVCKTLRSKATALIQVAYFSLMCRMSIVGAANSGV